MDKKSKVFSDSIHFKVPLLFHTEIDKRIWPPGVSFRNKFAMEELKSAQVCRGCLICTPPRKSLSQRETTRALNQTLLPGNY
jgi:hypothetical protein